MVVTLEKLWQNKKWLKNEYAKHGTSTIATKCGINDATVGYWLRKFSIPLRTRSESLKITDNRKYHVGYPNYFKNIDSHEKAYWLGFLMADGTMREYRPGCYMICFELAIKDADSVHRFCKAIKYDGKIYTNKEKCRAMIPCAELTQDLLRHGVIPNKTGHEIVPNIDSRFYSSFIRGFFDGDGSITFRKLATRIRVKFHLVCANYSMLDSIKNILIDFAKIIPSDKMLHEKYSRTEKTKQPVYEFETANMPNVAKIYDYLYNGTAYMKRKKDIFDQYMAYYITSPRVVKRYSPNCLETNRVKQK